MYLSEFLTVLRRYGSVERGTTEFKLVSNGVKMKRPDAEETATFEADMDKIRQWGRMVDGSTYVHHNELDETTCRELVSAYHILQSESMVSNLDGTLHITSAEYVNNLVEFRMEYRELPFRFYFDAKEKLLFHVISMDFPPDYDEVVRSIRGIAGDDFHNMFVKTLSITAPWIIQTPMALAELASDFYFAHSQELDSVYATMTHIVFKQGAQTKVKEQIKDLPKEPCGNFCVVGSSKAFVILDRDNPDILLSFGYAYSQETQQLVFNPVVNTSSAHTLSGAGTQLLTEYLQNHNITNVDSELERLFKLSGNQTAMSDLYRVLSDLV